MSVSSSESLGYSRGWAWLAQLKSPHLGRAVCVCVYVGGKGTGKVSMCLCLPWPVCLCVSVVLSAGEKWRGCVWVQLGLSMCLRLSGCWVSAFVLCTSIHLCGCTHQCASLPDPMCPCLHIESWRHVCFLSVLGAIVSLSEKS